MTRSVVQLGGQALKLDADGDTTIEVSSDDVLVVDTAGNEALKIDASGHVTKPLQSAFNVKPATTQANLATGTSHTVVWGTEIADRNNDFASNTFTAPVTGLYQMNVELYMQALDLDHSYYQPYLSTSNRNYYFIVSMAGFDADMPFFQMNFSVLADMDAGDTAHVVFEVLSGGSAQVDIGDPSSFSGYLVA